MRHRFLDVRLLQGLLAATLVVAGGLLPAAISFAPATDAARPATVADVASPTASAAVVPRSGPVSIPVGQGPDALAVDTANGTLFVADEYTNDVTEYALGSNAFLGTIPVGSSPCPGCLALDAANGTAYVANSGSNNVSAVSLGFGGVSATIPVGSFPDAILYNTVNKDVYVANAGAGTLTVISSLTNNVTLTIPVGPDPAALALDTANGNVLVAVAGSNNLTIVSAVTNVPVAVVTVGNNPGAIAYDPGNNEIYVANSGSSNVSVVGATNHTLDATISVGSGPSALAVDLPQKEVFVANRFSGNVSVISTKLQTVVANLTVGSQPGTAGAMVFDQKVGAVLVANGGSNNVSFLSTVPTNVSGSVPVLSIPQAIGVNRSSGLVYVADFGAGNVSIFSVSKVTFVARGLPPGSSWSVSAGSPALERTNQTFRASGTLVFYASNGSFPYAIHGPAGYGISHVVGPKGANQTFANLTGRPARFAVLFGPIEPLTVNESGLPAGAVWSVEVYSGFASAGPPSQTGTTNGTAITFSVVKGTWKYLVLTRPSDYRPAKPSGAVRVLAAPATMTLQFRLVARQVVFAESGLPPGTLWTVNFSGPVSGLLSGTSSSLAALLPNGTYTFVVSNYTSFHPSTGGTTHDQGTFTVVAPGTTLVERITYSSTP